MRLQISNKNPSETQQPGLEQTALQPGKAALKRLHQTAPLSKSCLYISYARQALQIVGKPFSTSLRLKTILLATTHLCIAQLSALPPRGSL